MPLSSSDRFRSALRAAKAVVWDLDLLTRETLRSGSSLDVLGIPSGTGDDFARLVHAEDRARVDAALTAAYAGEKQYDVEFRVTRPDGVQRWVHEVAEVHRDGDGRPVRLCGVTLDVTESKRVEEALRHSEQRLDVLANHAPTLLWFNGPEGAEYVNKTYLDFLGIGEAEPRTFDWTRYVHPDDLEPYLGAYRRAYATRAMFEGDFRFRRADGAYRWMRSRAVPRQDAAGAFLGYVGTSHDITEEKAAEERQQLLAAELDHRVRNILASIQAVVQLTARHAASKDALASAVRGRIGAMAYAHGLITQPRWPGAELADILRNALGSYGDAVRLQGPANCIIGPKDALNFALAVHELTTNAAKYGALSTPSGRVDISWRVESAHDAATVRLTWQESGGPPVKPPRREGFGSQLLRSALRDVALAFERPGLRCEMSFDLRRIGTAAPLRAAADPGAGPEDDKPGERPLYGQRVLVVEDDPLTALALRESLEGAGAEIAGVAGSVSDALALADRQPSVAVLDINLGGEMSYPVAERLLADAVPVLLTTGYDVRSVVPEALRMLPTLQKPIDDSTLIARLRELVEAR